MGMRLLNKSLKSKQVCLTHIYERETSPRLATTYTVLDWSMLNSKIVDYIIWLVKMFCQQYYVTACFV